MTDQPFRFPGERESPKTAARDVLDAAVLAHRADPSPTNEAAVRAAAAAMHEAFLAEQVAEFQDRTRGGRFTDWTLDNVVVHYTGHDDPRRSAIWEDDAPQRHAGDPYPPPRREAD